MAARAALKVDVCTREGMRLRLESRMEDAPEETNGSDEPLAMLAAADAATPNAWKIMSRFLYYQRHGACEPCSVNPTGMVCIYRTFEALLEARAVPPARSENWKALLHRHLGL